MKKWFIIIVCCFLGASLAYSVTGRIFGREYMPLTKVEKKWGKEDFNAQRFRDASTEGRAQMAYSLIHTKKYVKGPVDTVFQELGPSSGHFYSETVPAYVIGNINEKEDELWQLIFLLDKNAQIVTEVQVHKKCCYK